MGRDEELHSAGQGPEVNCPACDAEIPEKARFCIECGTPLVAGAESPAPAEPESYPEERRKATVIFADLSGYTAVSERVDPEQIKSLIDRALRRLGEEVIRYGGRSTSTSATT